MGVTKQYLRYVPGPVFGVTGSTKSNVVYLGIRGTQGKYCAVGTCEDVTIWDIRTSEKFLMLKGEKHEVTRISKSPDRRHIAVGYQDGVIRVFDLHKGEATVNFSGHKSAVTSLNYDQHGLRLVSGSKDTDIIIWDIVNEAGLYRLKGHKGGITQSLFLKDKNVVVSSSKDTFVKFWDLDTQHCFKTLVGHRSEVHDFVVVRNGCRLITGSVDSELRVWNIQYSEDMNLEKADDVTEPKIKRARVENLTEDDDDEEEDDLNILQCTKIGSVMRQGRDRVVSMTTDSAQKILACHGNESSLELFKLPTDEELKKHMMKRKKKLKKKLQESGEQECEQEVQITLKDEIQKLNTVKMSSKIVSVDVVEEGPDNVKVLGLLNNNSLQCCTISAVNKQSQVTDMKKVNTFSHRTDARTLSFSSDNTAILSASADSVKIWNRSTLQCIRTMQCDYALCSLFAPGDRHIVIGTKSGKLQLFEVGSSQLLEEIEAHKGAVWSICMAPDKRSIVSGSADKEIKFWNFELITDEKFSQTSKRLSLEHVKTLKMDEDVLAVKYSPDHRLLAASLLDNTVKVFFADTLKFFLSLYGHKLPVLCMDISYDSTLIITGSADRNIKIWGLDFGDCHKSIFAHDDSIMCLQFIAKTHLFFTGGKDGKIKQWDADNFEHIITLEGHHAEMWCLAVSSTGNFAVSGSHDKSLRLWEKTKEPLVLEEEREMEREKEDEEAIGQSGGEPVIPGETNKEVTLAGKKTAETVKGAEKIMEAIELYKEETSKLEQYEAECKRKGKQLPAPTPHPMMLAYRAESPASYMLMVIKKIKSSELEESLLVLPFNYVIDLLKILEIFVNSGWEVELSCRCLFFLLRVHQGQITSNQVLLPVIDRLRRKTVEKVSQLRDVIGFNMAGCQFLQKQVEQAQEVIFFSDATAKFKEKKKKQKKRAILSIKT